MLVERARIVARLSAAAPVWLGVVSCVSGVTVNISPVHENAWQFLSGKGRSIDIDSGLMEYRLLLQMDDKDAELPPHEMPYRIGLLTDDACARGWYYGGFVDIFIDGASVLDHAPDIREARAGDGRQGAVFKWVTPAAEVTMELTCREDGDDLFLGVGLSPRRPLESLRTEFLCFPGDFAPDKERDRWITTDLRDVRHRSEPVELDTNTEPWVFYYDKIWDPEGKKALGTCGLLYPPGEPETAAVEVSDYSVHTRFTYDPAQTRSIHYVLWEFPGESNASALGKMQSLRVRSVPGHQGSQ